MTANTQRDGAVSFRHLRSVLRHDLPASLVVFLVAVPLSLGIAVASGAPLIAGLIAAVVGGVVCGLFGGSAVQVSGPAAGLALVVFDLVRTYGWRATCMITLLAGVLQLLLGLFRVARAALAVSPAVVHGMLAGVGAVIALSQLHVVLGGSPQRSAIENISELPAQLLTDHTDGVWVGMITVAVLVLWAKAPHPLRAVPAPLAALLVAALATSTLGLQVTRVDLAKSIQGWQSPIWPQGDWHALAGAVLLVALLAGVESLLCSVGVDKLHDGPRADLDRELTGQGLANLVSGALGGLPVAGVIVRSTTNVRAGGRSRWSTILHGFWVLVFTTSLAWAVQLIPMEALAALLVFTGIKMIDLGHIPHLRGHGEVPVYLVTFFGVALLGLAEGVLLGLALAALLALRRLTWVTIQVTPEPEGRWHVLIGGSLTFLGVPRITAGLCLVPAGAAVDLDLNIDFMDNAAFEALHAWRLGHERSGGTVDIDEMHDEWYAMAASGDRMFPAKTPPLIPERWWLPLGHRQRRRASGPGETPPASARGEGAAPVATTGRELLAGAGEFHRRTAHLVRPFLTRMARKQEPGHLFITCSDSRIVPTLITASGPGDLFTVRNVGNLVPRRGAEPSDDSVVAALEYALRVLKVRTITVCGHTGCAAMTELLEVGDDPAGELPGLRRWLRHGRPSLERFATAVDEGGGTSPIDRLCRLNVLQQLEHLHTYPMVEELVAAGRLELVALYFDIAAARVHVLNRERSDPAPAPEPGAGEGGSARSGRLALGVKSPAHQRRSPEE
ncbi:SulP family inorganic anion transporter [Spongiactinospora sp. TRM90649]|uniref:SulP family inorganic anion transporter n=1 Tax=Spongiactinospora sp. TRM90649 TaxID=3031114 RepID=UPI0023F81C42|nr:SulP family inorganic anion transporter [Spongiactinospora sp. TRM90649]MDF5758086.1 SulP family inorganic anion transporter [Spongiactinospora sp. TRM90649]